MRKIYLHKRFDSFSLILYNIKNGVALEIFVSLISKNNILAKKIEIRTIS